MQWLILVENQEKALSIRNSLPMATVISTKGNPWDLEIELSVESLEYKIKPKEKYKDVIQKVQRLATTSDLVLLAFDPTNIGEASAREFEKLIGREICTRWVPTSLDKVTLIKTLEKFESHAGYRPKSSQTIAGCHWAQAITDIVWTNKVSAYLSLELETSVKMTRLMLAIIKSIADQERRTEIIKGKNIRHWEVEIALQKPNGEGNQLDSKVIVPTLSQIDSSGGKVTREMWKKKLRESRETNIEGITVGQPSPGKAWRFSSYDEATHLRNHIKKFPYFVVESMESEQRPQPVLCPLNYYSMLELAYRSKGATRKEIDETLNWLYLSGIINYPKTPACNLRPQTIAELFSYGSKLGWKLEKNPREFLGNEDENERTEALRPISWALTPDNLQYTEYWRANKHKDLSIWVYGKIFQRAKESQAQEILLAEQRHYLSGPLFITRKNAQEKQGRKFTINKENELQAHMSVLLGSTDPENWENIAETQVLETTEVYIRERKIIPPEDINISSIIEKLASENIGRIETLEHLSNLLIEQGLTEMKPNSKLTPKGWKILQELENSMGEYIDLNYYRCLAEMFKKIELGQKDVLEFLNEWWFNFRTILEANQQSHGSFSSTSSFKYKRKSPQEDNNNSSEDGEDSSETTSGLKKNDMYLRGNDKIQKKSKFA